MDHNQKTQGLARRSPKDEGGHARHYDVEALHEDYRQTFGLLIKALIIGVGGALLYFLVYVVYLGGWSHTPSTDYAKQFNERYPVDYKGLKLPEFGGPEAPEPAHHAAEESHAPAVAHGVAAANAESAAEVAHDPVSATTTVTETTPSHNPITPASHNPTPETH